MTPAELMPRRELPRSNHSLMLPPMTQTNSRLLLPKVQFQLPLKLTPSSSNSTPVVFSMMMVAEPLLTTASSLLVMDPKTDKNTSSSRTHGVLAGEMLVTSKSPTMERREMPVSAVLPLNPHSPRWQRFEYHNELFYLIH